MEMQVVDRKNIEKRLLYYWSKMYIQGIKKGEDYEKLERSVIVLFADYELDVLKSIEKYVTQWNKRKRVKKFKNKKENELDKWIQFLENPEGMKMGENKSVDKAKKILEEISQDERERYLAELREKYIMDQKAISDAGYDKGVKQGKKEGRKKLKEMKMSIADIEKVTGLAKEEIEKL